MSAGTVNPVGILDTPGTALSTSITPPFAYVADGTSGWHIVDISNPAAPVITTTIPAGTSGTVNHVVRQGNRVIGVVEGRGIVSWTIDPGGITEAGATALAGEKLRLDLNGECAAVATGTAGIQMVQTNVLSSASIADTETVVGTVRGLFRLNTSTNSPLYAAADTDGLRIYGVSGGSMVSLGTYDHPTGVCMDVVPMPDFATSKRLALAQNSGGIVIVDVTNSSTPILVQTMTTNASGTRRLSFSPDGTKLFAARGTTGVSAYNVATTGTPLTAAGTLDFTGFAYDVVAASALQCWVANGSEGLVVVTAPTSTSLALGAILPLTATSPATVGDELTDLDASTGKLFGIANASARLFKYNISVPAIPTVQRSVRVAATGLDSLELSTSGTNDRIFMGAGDYLQILDLPPVDTDPVLVVNQFSIGAAPLPLTCGPWR